jgi:RNA polymerase sigma factor (sigma-70 family)
MKRQDNKDYQAIWESFIKNGNQDAIGIIYWDHYDLLYNFGLKYINDVQIIEDAIQNIFSYFLKSGSKLSPVTNLRGYLIQSFRHQLLLDIKKRNRTYLLNNFKGKGHDSQEPEVNEIYAQEESSRQHQKLNNLMANLTKKQKEILYLRFQCELSYPEIAKMLGIAVDSCYKLIYLSLKELRLDLEKLQGVIPPLIMFLMHKSK